MTRCTFCIGPIAFFKDQIDTLSTIRKAIEFVPSSRVIDIESLYEGAHVRGSWFDEYDHHAIVTKIDKKAGTFTLIHLSGDGRNKLQNKPSIQEDTIKLRRNTDVTLVTYSASIPQLKRLPNPASVAVAEYFKDHPDAFQSYDLLTNNCEHLIFSCTLGYAISFQEMQPLSVAFLALAMVDTIAVNVLMNYLLTKQVVRYNEGDKYVTLMLQYKEVKIPFKI